MKAGRLLVVGGGSIGERHLRCFLAVDPGLEAELCEPRQDRAVELLERHPRIVTVHPDFRRIDLGRFDAAVVATPANLHVAQARALVEAGCHVLIEKPLCVLEGERRAALALAAAARRRRCVVGAAFTYRSYPLLMEMARQVRAGRIGKPFLARVTLAYDYPRYRADFRSNYFAQPDTGGGAVLDIASHALAFLTWVLGPIASVQAEAGRQALKGVAVEDSAVLALRFRSGAIAEVWASACQPRRRTEFELIGPGGHLRYATVFEEGRAELAWTRGDAAPSREGRAVGRMAGWEVRGESFNPDEPFEAQARNFLGAIAGRERVRTTVGEALDVQRACWAALRSARTGRRQRLGAAGR